MKTIKAFFGLSFIALLILTGVSCWRRADFFTGLIALVVRLSFMLMICAVVAALTGVVFRMFGSDKPIENELRSRLFYKNVIHPVLILFFCFWVIRYWL